MCAGGGYAGGWIHWLPLSVCGLAVLAGADDASVATLVSTVETRV